MFGAAIVGMLGTMLMVSPDLPASNADSFYARTMVVDEVTTEGKWQSIYMLDSVGNEWVYTDEGTDYEAGDCVSCVMYDNGTLSIYDDVIMSMRYDAWTISN